MYGQEDADYWSLIYAECDCALNAVGKLNYALVHLCRSASLTADQRSLRLEVFKSIDHFLMSAGRISLLIWPDKERIHIPKTADMTSLFLDSGIKTANLLRRRLGPKIKLRLNNHRLKDYFINHHERTELNTATLSIPGVIGSYLAFTSPFIPATPYFYDPVFRKYQCDEQTFDIQDIAAGLYTLKGIVKNERDKSLRDHEAVLSSVNLQMALPA